MILYTVHIYIKEEVAKDWYEWMIQSHIPDVMRTRCFDGSQIHPIIDPIKSGYKGFQIQYNTSTEKLVEYQTTFAKDLQKDHTQRYQGHFSASRFIVSTEED